VISFSPPTPYNFRLSAYASQFLTTRNHFDGSALWRTIRQQAGVALVRIEQSPNGHLHATIEAQHGDIDDMALAQQIRAVLALDVPLHSFYAQATDDPVLATLIRKLYGLHIWQTESLYEALMLTMIEQQISVSAAQKAQRWLLHTYGDVIEHQGNYFYSFPTAPRLAMLTVEDLIPLKITFERMRRMIAISQRIANGDFDIEALRSQDIQSVYSTLMALNGVGHWTAAWAMIRGLGHFAYVSSADVALRAAFNLYWHGQKGRATREATDTHFARYGESAGYAAVYTLMCYETERSGIDLSQFAQAE
jgi:DNA-3-methyladenine glycosylase II